MPHIRDITTLDDKHQHDCERIYIASYEMEEVIMPVVRKNKDVKAIHVTVYGRNFKAVAQPLIVFIGEQNLRFLRIAADENSVEGILLQEPATGDSIVVQLGDHDAARHPQSVDRKLIKRID